MEEERRDENRNELRYWKIKMLGSLALAVPIAIMMLLGRFSGIIPFKEYTGIVMLILGFPVIFIFGWRSIMKGLLGFYRKDFGIDSLTALGAVIGYSTGILGFFTSIEDYSGVSAIIMCAFITGKYMEIKARGKAGREIEKLRELQANNARVSIGSREFDIPIEELKIGNIVIVRPGEKVPSDGIVIKGKSSINEGMITGESIPSEKKAGDKVIGSTINLDGTLIIEIKKIGKDTLLANLIKIVEEAQETKVPIKRIADRAAHALVPAILIVSGLTFFGWIALLADWNTALRAAIAVLVIACPSSLGLAVPLVLSIISGKGTKKGIAIRKSEAIQSMKDVRTIVFAKTGTITKGKPEVTNIISRVKENYLLEVSASIENMSEHPLGRAIVGRAGIKKYRKVSDFKAIIGKGIEGKISGQKLIIGGRALMKENGISLSEIEKEISKWEGEGKSVIIVSEKDKAIGAFAIADPIRNDAIASIANLRKMNYKIVMVTGDSQKSAESIAKKIGISSVIGNASPEDKEKIVSDLQKHGKVIFVGDGANDAPAMKRSDISIAIGSGSDISTESGDIILVKESLTGIAQAINISKAGYSKMRQNVFWAFGYNLISIPLAVLGFLNPAIAEIAMVLSIGSVIINSEMLNAKI